MMRKKINILFLLLSLGFSLVSCANSEKQGTVSSSEPEGVTSQTVSANETSAPENVGKSGLKKDSVVVFTGDSIMDSGRADRNDPASLGSPNGLACLFNEYMKENFPEDNITVYNTGFTGYTINQILEKGNEFFASLKPDYLIIYVGTNNAWYDERPISDVENNYKGLLDYAEKNTDAEIIIFEPYLFESDLNFSAGVPLNTYVDRMAEISDMVCRVGAERNIPVIYSAELFRQAQEKAGMNLTRELTSDGIHPRKIGYKILFDSMMDTMGIPGYKMQYSFNLKEIKGKYGVK